MVTVISLSFQKASYHCVAWFVKTGPLLHLLNILNVPSALCLFHLGKYLESCSHNPYFYSSLSQTIIYVISFALCFPDIIISFGYKTFKGIGGKCQQNVTFNHIKHMISWIFPSSPNHQFRFTWRQHMCTSFRGQKMLHAHLSCLVFHSNTLIIKDKSIFEQLLASILQTWRFHLYVCFIYS